MTKPQLACLRRSAYVTSRQSIPTPRSQLMGAGAGDWPVFVDGGGSSYKTSWSGAAAVIVCLCAVAAVFLIMAGITQLCKRVFPAAPPAPPPQRRRDDDDDDGIVVAVGIDEATLQALPLVLYGEARTAQTSCAVCLESYGGGDVLRALPECGHLFHRDCIFTWLRRRPTCPVCRAPPSPAPPADVLG
uniref:RING-type domain-containing protein n=2 Tax=Oryza TaxID=4527 RepID=Q8H564_ORYSJ|nr:hypothetical protein [Oryza sativa Japonica Group]BAD31444.1 hypothetical protein [Oryza sativa Japonica Group]